MSSSDGFVKVSVFPFVCSAADPVSGSVAAELSALLLESAESILRSTSTGFGLTTFGLDIADVDLVVVCLAPVIILVLAFVCKNRLC